jgi:hypothetical protein
MDFAPECWKESIARGDGGPELAQGGADADRPDDLPPTPPPAAAEEPETEAEAAAAELQQEAAAEEVALERTRTQNAKKQEEFHHARVRLPFFLIPLYFVVFAADLPAENGRDDAGQSVVALI